MFEEIFEGFTRNLHTLKTFVSRVQINLEKESFQTLKDKREVLATFLYIMTKRNPEHIPEEIIVKMREDIDEKLLLKLEEDLINNPDTNVMNLFKNDEDKHKYIEFMEEITQQAKQIDMLYQSSLISLIVFFELLISRLIHNHVTLYPVSIKLEEKQLSFNEILNLGGIEEAKKYLIDKEIEGVMFGSFDKWYQYFKDKIRIDISFLDEVRERLVEVFQRRNLLVHNGGVVNSIYIRNVNEAYRNGLKLNDLIKLDREYINNCIELFENAGTKILLSMWKKAYKKSDERYNYLVDIAYNHMLQKNWNISKIIYNFLMEDPSPESSAETRLIVQVNYWLSLKRLGEDQEFQEHINKADFSAYNRRFQFCLLALKSNIDEFYSKIEASGFSDITIEELKSWPILEEVREDVRFNDLLNIDSTNLLVAVTNETESKEVEEAKEIEEVKEAAEKKPKEDKPKRTAKVKDLELQDKNLPNVALEPSE